MLKAREHEETERDTEGVGQDMSMPLKLFLVSGSLFSETSTQITTSIRGFLVKKQISMMADLSWGHKNIFLWGYKRSLLFVVNKRFPARRVRKELINS